MGALCYKFHPNKYMEAKLKRLEKCRGVQDTEIGIIDYYSEGFGHEGNWVVESNRWDIGGRERYLFAYFLVITSTSIQNLSHICIHNTYKWFIRERPF